MNNVFVELQNSYFFCLKTTPGNNEELIPYQPILWHVFTNIIDKNKKQFYIQIAKSIPSYDLVSNYGKIC